MTKVFIIFLGLFLVACSATQTANYNAPKVAFSTEFSSEKFDNAYDPILNKYQEILKGMLAKDTTYLFNVTRELIQLSDSIAQIKLEKDTISQERLALTM